MVEKVNSSDIINKLIWVLWGIQILLGLSAMLFSIDTASDLNLSGALTFASILSYIALISVGYSLANQIADEDRSELSRLFSFIYYFALTIIMYVAAMDPALLLVAGGLI